MAARRRLFICASVSTIVTSAEQVEADASDDQAWIRKLTLLQQTIEARTLYGMDDKLHKVGTVIIRLRVALQIWIEVDVSFVR